MEGLEVSKLEEMYYNWIENQGYTDHTVKVNKRLWHQLKNYIGKNGINTYSIEVGEKYRNSFVVSEGSYRPYRNLNRMIYVLNCLIASNPILIKEKKTKKLLVSEYQKAFDGYVNESVNNGNRDRTIYRKKLSAYSFFSTLEKFGYENFSEITPEVILKVVLAASNKYHWSVYKQILKYLAMINLLRYDYSALIPSNPNTYKIPDVYSREEILAAENSIDQNTEKGIRDYAMFLLASRLVIRSIDIVNLKLTDLDFEEEKISFVQQKNNIPIQLPMVKELKNALQNYIHNARPQTEINSIFIRTTAPFTSITTGTVYHMVSDAFVNAGVNIANKRHGPHALRASGSTHMVNSDIPYPMIKKALGHKDSNVIQSYAKIDIEKLRQCALKPPDLNKDSIFAKHLKGEF